MAEIYTEDVAKYRKKKESTTSKSSKKANHKHDNIEVLIFMEDEKKYRRGEVCKICGKIRQIHYFELEEVDPKEIRTRPGRRMLWEEEILIKYANLPKVRAAKFMDSHILDVETIKYI